MAKRKPKKIVETPEEATRPIESPNVAKLDLSVRISKLEARVEKLIACILRAQPPKDV